MTRAMYVWILAALIGTAWGPRSTLAEPSAAPSAGPADSSQAPETPLAWSVTYASRYCFQGLDYSDGRPVLQPQMSARFRRITIGIWGNLDPARGELDELDLSCQAELALDRFSGALGYVHLRYPHRDWEPTQELFADLALEAPLQPSLGVHSDVVAGRGRYWTLGLNHEVPWRGAGLALGAKLYVHEHYYGMTGIPALEISAGITVARARLSLQPLLSRYWTWPNGHFRGDQAVNAGWVFGLTASSP